jgi:hypothetical protein
MHLGRSIRKHLSGDGVMGEMATEEMVMGEMATEEMVMGEMATEESDTRIERAESVEFSTTVVTKIPACAASELFSSVRL